MNDEEKIMAFSARIRQLGATLKSMDVATDDQEMAMAFPDCSRRKLLERMHMFETYYFVFLAYYLNIVEGQRAFVLPKDFLDRKERSKIHESDYEFVYGWTFSTLFDLIRLTTCEFRDERTALCRISDKRGVFTFADIYWMNAKAYNVYEFISTKNRPTIYTLFNFDANPFPNLSKHIKNCQKYYRYTRHQGYYTEEYNTPHRCNDDYKNFPFPH